MLTIGVDVGSTAVKAAALAPEGEIRAVTAVEYQSFSPRPGWIEQDPDELWQATCTAIASTVRQLGRDRGRIRAVALSVQRGTFVPVDRAGRAIYRAVSWQDLRPGHEWLAVADLRERFTQITGLYPAPYWAVGKLAWIAHNEPELWRAAERFLFVHGYLSQRLGCVTAVEDPTNASFSGLLDVGSREWSDQILETLGLKRERLGLLREPGTPIGEISRLASASTALPVGTTIVCGAGDQQAVALGAGIIAEGSVAVNVGTAGIVLACSTARLPAGGDRVACLAHPIPRLYQVEGMLGSAGSVLRWLASLTKSATGFRFGGSIDHGLYRQIDAEAVSVPPGCEGLLVIPLFSEGRSAGGRRPGAMIGLSLSHNRATIARAIMEGIAFEVRRMLHILAQQGVIVRNIILCGGASQSSVWNQIHADVLAESVTTLACPHAGVVGAALLAAVGVGGQVNIETGVREVARPGSSFEPGPQVALYDQLFAQYELTRAMLIPPAFMPGTTESRWPVNRQT